MEVARSVEGTEGHDAARRVLEAGLEKAPTAVELYLALYQLEARAGAAAPAARPSTGRPPSWNGA